MPDHLEDPKGLIAIIDIGSNSVRLVVYSGLVRVPDTVFNEKILCGLGAELGSSGKLGQEAVDIALSTLKRFRMLCDHMGVRRIIPLATAAVRDADNGQWFADQVRETAGLDIQVIDGDREGLLAGYGILSGSPNARGISGDLGGGSLELTRIAEGSVHQRYSLPIGPLRMVAQFGEDMDAMRKFVRAQIRNLDWLKEAKRETFYLVGGAWRNLGKILMRERALSLPVLHGYALPAGEMADYAKRISRLLPADIPYADMLPSRRLSVLPVAAMVLREVIRAFKPAGVMFSSYGVREGFLYEQLDTDQRAIDPFLFQCLQIAVERSRFPEHAEDLYQWTRPLFAPESLSFCDGEGRERLHLAVCLLSDSAWRGHPDFRAEKAVESALHGYFVGVGHAERVFVAVALAQAYGAPMNMPALQPVIGALTISEILEARLLGASLRLAQRVSGGVASALNLSRLSVERSSLVLRMDPSVGDIANAVVERRLAQLGQLMGRRIALLLEDPAKA